MSKVIPEGTSTFKHAYAYGIGMLLTFNHEHFKHENALTPEYLHLVISSDSIIDSSVTKSELV